MANEDFTTYTEVDPGNDLSSAATKITVTGYTRDAETYEYYDKGVDRFSDFSHNFTVNIGQSFWYPFCPWAVANDLGAERTLAAAGKTFRSIEVSTNNTNNFFTMRERDGGTNYSDGYTTGSGAKTLYCTVDITVSSYKCYIYSNSDRTTLLDTLSITLQNQVAMRYIYGFMGIGNATGDPVSGYIGNLDLQEAVAGIAILRRRREDYY